MTYYYVLILSFVMISLDLSMDKNDADLIEEIPKQSEESPESIVEKCDGLKRPNHQLLRLARLNNGSKSSDETKSPKLNSHRTNEAISFDNSKSDVSIDIPPPSYESVVKFNPELNTTSTVSSTSQLPSYQEVGGLSDAPPPYHSIFTETVLRAIHPFNSEDTLNRNAQNARFSSIIVNVLLFVFMASFVFLLPVSMIAMGIIYVHKCPVQPRLPIYLIVLGFFQMLECCGRLAFKLFHSQNNRQNETWRDRYRRKDPLIYFVIVWFIIGSMWVYQTDPFCKTQECMPTKGRMIANVTLSKYIHYNSTTIHNYITSTPNCDKTIYAFAFWIVTSYYSVIAFFFLLVLFDVITRVFTRFCCPGRQGPHERTT